MLINTYHALCQPEDATPGSVLASSFIDFLASEAGQEIIRNYGKEQYGEGLHNNVLYAAKYDD